MESYRIHVSGGTHWTPRDSASDPGEASLLPIPQLAWPLGVDSSFCKDSRKQDEGET